MNLKDIMYLMPICASATNKKYVTDADFLTKLALSHFILNQLS